MRSVFGLVVGDTMQQQQLWKVLDDGVCDVKCPPANYTESLTDPHRCNKCDDSCPKGKNVFDFNLELQVPWDMLPMAEVCVYTVTQNQT